MSNIYKSGLTRALWRQEEISRARLNSKVLVDSGLKLMMLYVSWKKEARRELGVNELSNVIIRFVTSLTKNESRMFLKYQAIGEIINFNLLEQTSWWFL